LLAAVPPDAKVILEVGCGAGTLMEAYKRINPACRYLGIETNESAIAEADRRGMKWIWTGDVEELLSPESWRGDDPQVDVLICGDVLEHLRDPWKTLKRLSEWVRPGGLVIASIPNVAHFSLCFELLYGLWRYQDAGLLDRTHTKFFTLSSIHELFTTAGLSIFDIRGISYDDAPQLCEMQQRWSGPNGLWPRIAEWMREVDPGANPDWLGQQHQAYQFLVRAIRPPSGSSGTIEIGSTVIPIKSWRAEAEIVPLRIHAVVEATCCARPRVAEPFQFLNTIPGVTCTMSPEPLDPTGELPDILIQQRHRSIDWDRQRKYLERCLVIAEIDDDPESLEGVSDDDFAPLRACHAVQVSTEALAETCRRWNSEVVVVPNQIAELPPPKSTRSPYDRPMIFYGALNRENDWKPIMPALNRVLKDNPEVGICVVHDRQFFDALEVRNGIQKGFHPFCPYEEYRRLLRLCDIALLPLEPTRFNKHKSDIKFLECASEDVAVLASLTVYGDTIFDGRTGLIYHEYPTGSFGDYLERLIRLPALRQTLAANAYAYVRDHRLLSSHYRDHLTLYQSLLRRRPDLDRALSIRVTSCNPE
jgi:2-polyprenyl-3-methyl-5-hydroxy-6-metoxy-1,4-benzoquinol methylase/glycosyltransferase involved in cell wall biosynthesis